MQASIRFNQIAPAYARYALATRGVSAELLRSLAVFQSAKTIVDVGCGAGSFSLEDALPTQTVIGIDPAPRMLEQFMTRAMFLGVRAKVVCAKAEELPLAAELHDLVVSRWTLHHCADAAAAVREMLRILKPGGSLVISDLAGFDDPRLDFLNNELLALHDPSHLRSLCLAEAEGLCIDAGARLEMGLLVERELAPGLALAPWFDSVATPVHRRVELTALLATLPRADLFNLGIITAPDGFRVSLRSFFLHVVKPSPQ